MPYLWVLAGPNGSGKSTVTRRIVDNAPGVYINADQIEARLGCTAMDAALIAEETREYYLSLNEDFTFETVLSTDRNLNLMQRAKEQGYEITCLYIITKNPEINVSRVKKRARFGGHDVPADKVRSRYQRCVKLLPRLLPICNHLLIFDNSGEQGEGTAAVIAYAEDGEIVEISPNAMWTESDIRALLNGNHIA